MMKRLLPVFVCAVLVALLVADIAQAATVDVQNTQGMGVRLTSSTAGTTASTTYDKSYVRGKGVDPAYDWGKVWLQYDLSSVWATYGKENLASASLTIWSENGIGRRFSVAGLLDGLTDFDNDENEYSLESWTQGGLDWYNAPGQDAASGTALDWTKVYGGAALWTMQTSTTDSIVTDFGAAITGITDTNFDQCARYQSIDGAVTAANANLLAFLGADTDGLVTLIGYDHTNSSNQFWWIGTAGTYSDPLFNGELIRNSPTLTLTFVPEPATLAILGLGGLFLRRRLA